MATRTSNGTGGGDFSVGATWAGGTAPVNGDAFVIAAGDVVVFDQDTSGYAAGFAASTINGTLRAKRAAGSYFLKMSAGLSIATTGVLDASDGSGGAYRSDATFTIQFATGFGISGAGSAAVNLICGEPTHKYAKLSQAESSSATTLHVDTDLTGGGDALWANGSLVRIDNINGVAQSEQYTISSVTSGTVVIASGLTNSNLQGSKIILISRNVKIIGGSTASGTGITGFTASPVIGAEVRVHGTGVGANTGATVTGTISNCTTGIGSSALANSIHAPITGCSTGVSGGTGGGWGHALAGLISGCTAGTSAQQSPNFTGEISGCNRGMDMLQGGWIGGTIQYCTTGLLNGAGFVVVVATLQNNTQDIGQCATFAAYNTRLGSSIEFLNYNGSGRSAANYAESLDHDQVAGAFRAWTRGGITSSDTGTVYDASRPRSYHAVCESASVPAFFQREVLVPAGGTVHVRCYARKDTSMAGYLPRVWVFSADKEPLLSGTADAEVTMTDGVDAWDVLEASATNTGDAAKKYVVRCLAKNASGSVYFDPIIRTSGFVAGEAA